MSAALSRFANPAARIGHAGDRAPVLDDARDLFLADLPVCHASGERAADGLRARLLVRELEAAREQASVLREALRQVLAEVRPEPDERPFDSDSHLPPQLIAAIERALVLGSLR